MEMISHNLQNKKNKLFNFVDYTIWLILTTSLILLTKFEVTVEITTKVLIPALFLFIIVKKGGLKINNKGLLLYICFTLWSSLSILYTVNSSMTLSYLQKLLGNVLIWFIVDYCIERIDNIKYLIFPVFLIYLIHLYFGFFSDAAVSERDILRSTGLTDNPNSLGFLLWYGITIATLLASTFQKFSFKIVLYICVLAFLFGIFDTASRKNLFATIIFFGTYVFLLGKKKNYSLFLSIIIIGYFAYDAVYDFIMNNTHIGSRLASGNIEAGADVRSSLILEGWEFFLSNPLLGIGLGSFTTFSYSGHMSHNDYIEILSSMGIVAFILYMLIFKDFFIKNLFLINLKGSERWLAIPCSFLLGYLFLGMGRPAFLDPMATLMLALYYGLIRKEYFHYIKKQYQ